MSFTFDNTDNTGKVRALIGDTTEATALLSDEEIAVYLSLTSNDLLKSAAMGLRAIVQKLVSAAKKERAGDYETDNRQNTTAMLDLAKHYETLADSAPADAQVTEILTDFNYDQELVNRVLRNEPLDT